MVNAWDGPDPTAVDDGATYYEMGESWSAVADITVSAVRVWQGAASMAVVGRQARIWTTGGSVLATADLDDTLAPGWTTYDLDAPLEVQAGTDLVISYSTLRYYGAVSGSYPNESGDGAVEYTAGRYTESNLFPFPTTITATFYGIDLVYEVGIGGNLAPSVTVTATAAGRTVTAVAVADDEAPGSLTYRWEWGDGQVTADGDATEQHTYAADGLYAVLVTVTDTGGLRDSDAAAVLAATGNPNGLELSAVMLALAARLDTVPGLNVYTGWPDKVVSPAVIVAFPESVTYDTTYRRGADTFDIPVVLALRMDPAELADVSPYVTGAGASSVKAVLESGAYSGFGKPHVRDAQFDVAPFAGKRHLVAVFGVTVTG
jgi:hypothetical protein